jgi:hypothetical protein
VSLIKPACVDLLESDAVFWVTAWLIESNFRPATPGDVAFYQSGHCMRLNSVGSEQAVAGREDAGRERSVDRFDSRGWLVSLTSFVFVVLQSACSAAMAISGIRVLIGLGALAAVTAGAQVPPGGHHRDAIRIPMMIVAVVGSLINLYVIWRIRSLRKRPSAQWRQQIIPRKKIWSENGQVAMAVVTLVLVAAELLSHQYIFRFVK